MGLKKSIKKLLRQRVRRTPKILGMPDALNGVLAYNKHGGYCVPTSSVHRAACQMIMRGKVWEAETIAYICRHADGDIVHAGTYFGDFLPAIAKAAGENLIWAFEPSQENFRCAEVTVQINNLKNVRLHNAALGESEAALPFQLVDERGRSLGGWCRASDTATTTVPQLVLDRVIPADRHVSVVHLDVEFFEGVVLAGARQLLRRCRPIVILENVPDGFAKEYGYEADRVLDGNTVFLPASRATEHRADSGLIEAQPHSQDARV